MLDRLAISTTALHPLAHIRAWKIDVDDCAADGSNNDIGEEWHEEFAQDCNLSVEEVRRINPGIFHEYGCSATGFAKIYNLPDPENYVERIYASTAARSAARFLKRHTPDPELFNLMHRLTVLRKILPMIITQGHPDHYNPILDHLGMGPFIAAHHRLDRLNTPFSKREAKPFEIGMEILRKTIPDLMPEEVAVFEDTPLNLVAPAAMGMTTILVGSRDPGPVASSIHYHFPTFKQALQAFES